MRGKQKSQRRDSFQSSLPKSTDLKSVRSLTTQKCTSLHSPTAATGNPGGAAAPVSVPLNARALCQSGRSPARGSEGRSSAARAVD